MSSGQINAFTDQLPIGAVTEDFLKSMRVYGEQYNTWVIWSSGGKDSVTVSSMILWAISTGQIKRPENLYIRNIDTRLELPPLEASNFHVMNQFTNMGFDAEIVTPPEEVSLIVAMIGRGVSPPTERMRYCTYRTKVEPQKKVAQEIFNKHGKFLSITGYRRGESETRDGKIEKSCNSTDGECGITFYQELPDNICANLAPIIHFQACQVWDWIFYFSKQNGFDFDLLKAAYGHAGVRFGCVGCPVIRQDWTLIDLCKRPAFFCYTPLLKINDLFRTLRRPQHRVRRKTGHFGAISIKSRKWALKQILLIQIELNEACDLNNMPRYIIINERQISLIKDHHKNKTWPRGYDGTQEESMLQEIKKHNKKYEKSLFPIA